jgi:uroporphyrinogen III methyltransferase / synthase
MNSDPRVYLVGAGPGNPGYLTLRAAECLARADLVLYDKLVPPQMLDHAPPTAQRVCVGDLAERHLERYIPVHNLLLQAARQGKCVVRLKGGDPFLFGRGGEEAEVLRAAGIPYEVVPGVTAALGAAACAGIPLTHRAHASAVAFVTGHENPAKPESALDWAALARFPGTLAIYMGMSRLGMIVQTLLAHGKPPDTPAAVVQRASTGEQQTVEAPLADIARAAQAAGLGAPAITLIGSVVGMRSHLAWFETRPLFGKRVLVTRPRRQAGDLVRRLEELGAVVFVQPAVDILPPDDWGPVDRAIERLSDYQWLVFTSVNGVSAFLDRLRDRGRDLRALGGIKLAAIGPGTSEALERYHLKADAVPAVYDSEHLAAALLPHVCGQRVLLARANRGRELLREELTRVAEVDQIAVYAQKDALTSGAEVLDAWRRGEIDFVTVTSANIARALAAALDAPCRARLHSGEVKLVSISGITSEAIRCLNLPVEAEAREATSAGIVDAIITLARRP